MLQALPIFLDKLLDPVLAVVLSVTAVLLVGMQHSGKMSVCPAAPCQLRPAAVATRSLPAMIALLKHPAR